MKAHVASCACSVVSNRSIIQQELFEKIDQDAQNWKYVFPSSFFLCSNWLLSNEHRKARISHKSRKFSQFSRPDVFETGSKATCKWEVSWRSDTSATCPLTTGAQCHAHRFTRSSHSGENLLAATLFPCGDRYLILDGK